MRGATSSPAGVTYRRTRRVYVGDDDASGLIYFPMYYHYMAEAEQEWFAELGRPVWDDLARGVASPVAHSACDYLAPVHAGDALAQSIDVTFGRTSVELHHVFTRGERTEVARGRIVRVWVDMATMEPQPVPDEFRALFA